MNKTSSLFLCAFSLLCVVPFHSGAAAAPVIWSYKEKNYELYSPQFSADNSRLVFARKRHIPDGHEAELFSEKELRKIWKQVEINERFADPEIMLVNLADKSARHIDYGWDPAFSHDQTKIVYAHQKNPISRRRILAATLAGNEIRERDIARNETAVVAQPASGYLSAPRPAENGTIFFALSGAINGGYGGDVGVGAFDPAAGKQTVLYKPIKEYGFYHWVKKFAARDGQCLALRLRPLDAGDSTYTAGSYAYELVDAASGAALYSWGAHELGKAVPADFRMCPRGPEIYDGGWRALDNPASERSRDPSPGFSSPDCARVAVIGERKVIVLSLRGEPEARWNAPKGEIQSVTWSPDSSRIALVISHGSRFSEKFQFDELVILPAGGIPSPDTRP
ncbi:hypothetical protein FACS1894206_07770 [Deltaproteobacteria bacterium]|nr:hypothetical protein FACS1894206_07770 [Deltaproteobacteria bacterium]